MFDFINNTTLGAAILTAIFGIIAKIIEVILNWVKEKKRIKFEEVTILKRDIQDMMSNIIIHLNTVYEEIDEIVFLYIEISEYGTYFTSEKEMNEKIKGKRKKVKDSVRNIYKIKNLLELKTPLKKFECSDGLIEHIECITDQMKKDITIVQPAHIEKLTTDNLVILSDKHENSEKSQKELIKKIPEKTKEFIKKLK
ncbi:MAG: hypothetical protein L0L22_13925 [Staphylococcus equorum]|nr:hypothetical protein [Staphylococcus equorum]